MAANLIVVLIAALFSNVLAHAPVEIVDLTYVYDSNTVNWPGNSKFELKISYDVTEDGHRYQTEKYSSSTHFGTHMDAPCHFFQDRWCIEDIPVDRFIAPAAVIDITHKAVKNRDALASVSDLRNWEIQYHTSLDGHIVVIRSGWGCRWGDMEAYSGTAQQNNSQLHFPGIAPEAATFLANNRSIYSVAIDTMSLDNGPSKNFFTHRILLQKNIYGLENVANLDKLPPIGAIIHALPMKIGKASGAPARVVAFFSKNDRIP